MPEASLGDIALAQSTKFTGRLQVLLCRYAQVVATMVSPPTPHSKNLAARILSDPGGMTGKIAVALVSDGGITGTGDGGTPLDSTRTDAQLDGVIQAVFNSGKWDQIV